MDFLAVTLSYSKTATFYQLEILINTHSTMLDSLGVANDGRLVPSSPLTGK